MTMRTTSGYAPVNGLQLYYEVHGTGRPIVLLHGGVLTIDLCFGAVLPALAATRQVIALELQGHGHTADIERDPTVPVFATDVIAVLDHLGITQADFLGFSLGGLTTFQVALTHPERVGHQVVASIHSRADGYHEELRDPEKQAGSVRMPTEADFANMRKAYERIAPDPGNFDAFVEHLQPAVGAFQGWPDAALRGLDVPTLVVVGDTDFVLVEHATEMHHLIPGSQLAVLPGTTHMGVMRRSDLLLPLLDAFLPPSSAAASLTSVRLRG